LICMMKNINVIVLKLSKRVRHWYKMKLSVVRN
jgi:hypothetical protein